MKAKPRLIFTLYFCMYVNMEAKQTVIFRSIFLYVNIKATLMDLFSLYISVCMSI